MAPKQPHPQDEVQAHSITDPESFWKRQAEQLHWHKKPSRALARLTKNLSNGISHPSFKWFPDGEISTSYNCVDRHVENGNGDATAIIWDSPVTGSKEKYTYSQLLQEVETLAGVLREEGVRKGDVVLVYSTYESCPQVDVSMLILSSAHDSFCVVRNTRNLKIRRYSHRRVWRVCACVIGTKNRGFQTSSYHDRLLWDRGFKRANEL